MFAVVAIGSKQYKVAKGDSVVVDRLAGRVGETLTFNRVLLVDDDKGIRLGTPTLKGVKVTAKILGQEKGKKIEIRRFKSKVRERRHIGFRPLLTRLEIVSIGKA